jgi:oligopeptidase B
VLLLSGCADRDAGLPEARQEPVELTIHGDTRIDEFFWLRERDNPAVIDYLEAENAYAESVLEETSGLFDRLVEEMRSRVEEEYTSAPYRHGDYFYYYRYGKGQEFPVYCRREGSLSADEEVLLDVNAEAAGEPYYSVRAFGVSPDHSLAAYAVDTVGRRFYDVNFLDLETGAKLPDRLEDVTGNLVWANDNKTVFFVKQHPETLRSYRVYRYELGSGEEELVFEQADETFYTGVSRSLSGNYLFIVSSSTLTSEYLYLSADDPSGTFEPVLAREPGHEYSVVDGGDRFYILSNDGATNFRLLEAPYDNLAKEAWQVVVPHREDVLVEDVEAFAGHLALATRRDGLTRIEILDRGQGILHEVAFDEPAFDVALGDNYEYDSTMLRLDYESLTTPDSVYDYDMTARELDLVRQEAVLGGFDRDDYRAERLTAPARDGTPVPVTLVYRKGIQLDGSNPLLIYGYGSYGSSQDPRFDSNLLSLLDRGFVYAVAHIRGGSEMGRHWYEQGRQQQKKNTFTDFIDVTRFLIDEGYTSPEHVYARGGSAGGLLMGAIANMAPELYNGISTRVPFVDVVTTMLDESIPLTSGEWDEWGDPRDPEDYAYMLSYSPYDQVSAQAYPNILVTTGLHDSQVQYWEPAKWVARLRDRKTDNNLLLLKTDMNAGHSGKTGRFKRLEDTALYYTFFLYLEGINE